MDKWLEKSSFLQKNMAIQCKFAKLYLNKPQTSWNNIVWTVETNAERSYLSCAVPGLAKTKHSTSLQTPRANYPAWWWDNDLCFLCSHRTWKIDFQSMTQQGTETNVRPPVQQLKLGWNWVMKQDNDPKHSSFWMSKEDKNLGVVMAKSKSRRDHENCA